MAPFNVQNFAEEYADRLRSIGEYTPTNLFLPTAEAQNVGTQFRTLINNSDFATEQAFVNRYLNDYLPRVTQLAEDANLPNIRTELDDFVAKTGLPDPRLKNPYFNLESAKHEIVSHMRPYNAGFSPDYRNLEGLDANPVSPFNERFATQLDGFIADNYTQGRETGMFTPRSVQGMFAKSGFENALQESLQEQAIKGGLSPEEAASSTQDFMRKNFPKRGDTVSESVSTEIADQLNKKYLPNARYNFGSTGKLFYPTGGVVDPYTDNRVSFQNILLGSRNPEVSTAALSLTNPGVGYMSMDPVTASVGAIKNVVKQNPVGTSLGVATSLLDPDLPKAVEEDDYLKAGEVVARDVLGGAATEQALKVAGKYIPQLAPVVPILGKVAPVVTGASLFSQGKEGSLTDVITTKAAENQIPFLPSNAPNPETDLGARSARAIANEGKYIFNSLLKGKLPYMR
jgi:hypothetical protein